MDAAKSGREGMLRLAWSAAATVQMVWFYLARVPTAFSLDEYEQGHAPVPFQHRLALRPALLWAHGSPVLNQAAAILSRQHAWFPHGVRPEALIELPIDVLAVALTGWIAERLYRSASRLQLLRGLVYPLTVAMAALVFDFYTVHNLRFVYDLPAMAVFASGLYLLYTRRPLWQFALLFLCGTLNRETTLLLVPAMLLQQWSAARASLAASLLTFWFGWHVWITHAFAANPSAAGPRLLLNLGVLLCPPSWPQIGTFVALCIAPAFCCDGYTLDPLLRRWRVLVALWIAFMLRYGLLIETRVFGELIAYLAPMAALAAEGLMLRRLESVQRVITRTDDAVMVN